MSAIKSGTAHCVSEFGVHVLREYSLLADGERGILVGPSGDYAWMCAPRWHDDAVFSTLIGGGGCYAVTPDEDRFVWGGYYERGSLIWRSRWVTTSGILECREALACPAERGRAVSLRRIHPVEGPARVRVVFDPQAEFGRYGTRDLSKDDGVWSGRSGDLYWRLSGLDRAKVRDDGALEARLDVSGSPHHDLVLEIGAERLPDRSPDADDGWSATEHWWRSNVPDLDQTIAPGDARHAYCVLHGLTSADGGMVAAATMSLPERADTGRNYDYRYAWIRDQCYAGQAVAAAGPHPLLDRAVQFVSERLLADADQMVPAYTVDGGRVPDEQTLDLPGYPGGSDKVGNWVNGQFQLDAFGEALLLLAAAARHDRLDVQHWAAAKTAVQAIEKRWTDPDAGIWEIDDRRWAHSRLICAAGLRAMGRVESSAQTAEWSRLADAIVADASKDCMHPSGRWQRSPDDERVDGALLLPALRGAVPPDDPRSTATLDAVLDDLGRDHFLYRFQHGDLPLHEAEGAFILCGFQAALALHQQGRTAEALRWFERNRAACGPPGLFAEEYDVVQRQLRGNLPQAFVHAQLLEASVRLAEPTSPLRTSTTQTRKDLA